MEPPLEYYASRQSLHDLDADRVVAVVDALTDEGVWDPAFLDVMDAHSHEAHDVLPPFLTALGRLGVQIPSKDEAVWYLIDFHTARIAGGEVEPLEGLEQMIRDIYWDYDFGARSTKYFGDSHGD